MLRAEDRLFDFLKAVGRVHIHIYTSCTDSGLVTSGPPLVFRSRSGGSSIGHRQLTTYERTGTSSLRILRVGLQSLQLQGQGNLAVKVKVPRSQSHVVTASARRSFLPGRNERPMAHIHKNRQEVLCNNYNSVFFDGHAGAEARSFRRMNWKLLVRVPDASLHIKDSGSRTSEI